MKESAVKPANDSFAPEEKPQHFTQVSLFDWMSENYVITGDNEVQTFGTYMLLLRGCFALMQILRCMITTFCTNQLVEDVNNNNFYGFN